VPPGLLNDPDSSGHFEYCVEVDPELFPRGMNIIGAILGPKGKHQQRMRLETGTHVNMITNDKKPAGNSGQDNLILHIKSKDRRVPLTWKQINKVKDMYGEIITHIRLYGTSEGIWDHKTTNKSSQPQTLQDFLWNLHSLLVRNKVVKLHSRRVKTSEPGGCS
jgi:hypothetical protein